MTYVDRRIGGVERWYATKPKDADLRIDPALLDCVCFLVVKPHTGEPSFAGTAFLLSLPFASRPDWRHLYLVTAQHVVKGAGTRGELYARLNVRGGGTRDVHINDAWAHAGDADLSVVAAPVDNDIDAGAIYGESLVTDARVWAHDIGVGDDVVVTGLFARHPGAARNAPIVRSGTIAAMPGDPVLGEDGRASPGYLVEMRSMAGLSGSPVLVAFGYERPVIRPFEQPPTTYLLGVVRGHWDHKLSLPALDATTKAELARLNQGIAIVTPAQALRRLLDKEDLVKKREAAEREHEQRDALTLDAGDDIGPARGPEPERLKIDASFEDAARKLVQTPRPEGGWPKGG